MANAAIEKTPPLIRLDARDNVAVATAMTEEGVVITLAGLEPIRVLNRISIGHKVAIRAISSGEKILKFGFPIGSATRDIAPGEHVHTHNLKSDYLPTFTLDRDRQFVKG